MQRLFVVYKYLFFLFWGVAWGLLLNNAGGVGKCRRWREMQKVEGNAEGGGKCRRWRGGRERVWLRDRGVRY
jgi:hypothetical protein